MDPKNTLSEISKRKKLFSHYIHNSNKNFIFNNIAKSSEFLWGALHTLIYSIALTYNKKISNHGQIRNFAKELSEYEKDQDIFKGVVSGETLHANFYHNFLDKDQFEIKREEINKLIIKLEIILEKRIEKIEIEMLSNSF